jgi:hypothetical protein
VDFAAFLGWGLDVIFINIIDMAHGIGADAFSSSTGNIKLT